MEFHTFVCPICGSTDLTVEVLVSAKQNLNGEWNLAVSEDLTPEDIYAEVTNVNNEVTCLNPFCGTTSDATGRILTQEELDDTITTFCKDHGITLEEYTEKDLMEYDPGMHAAYEEWIEGFSHEPWKGKIGDCTILE